MLKGVEYDVHQPTQKRQPMKQIPTRFRVDQVEALEVIHRKTRIPRQLLIREAVDLYIAEDAKSKAGKPAPRGKRQATAELTTAVA